MPRSVQISMGKIPAIVIAIAVPACPGKAAGYSLPQNRIAVCVSSQVTPRIRKCPSVKFKRKKKKVVIATSLLPGILVPLIPVPPQLSDIFNNKKFIF